VRILSAQLARTWSYSSTRALALLLLVGMAVALAQYTLDHRPPSEANIAAMERQYEAAVKDWQENGDQITRECLAAEAESIRRGEPTTAYHCDRLAPNREAIVDLNGAHYGDLFRLVLLFVFAASAVAFLVSAAGVNLDVTSNVLSTELTFEPRRSVVFLGRLGAAAVTSLAFGFVASGLGAGLAFVLVRALAATASDARGDLSRLLAFSLRSTLIVLAVGAIGFSLTWLTRHLLAALLIVGAWFAFVELPVSQLSFLAPLRAWTFSSNLEALAYGRGSYELVSCNPVDGCLVNSVTFSALHAIPLYVGVPLVLAAVAAASFRRRDVT
jgi:ABC-2 type transport system permease protein